MLPAKLPFCIKEKALNTKLNNITRVIKDIDADIISLQEIESKKALSLLLEKLKKYKHSYFLKNKNSAIGLAILSKFPIIKNQRIKINNFNKHSRPILKSTISINNHKLIVYTNHWKSKRSAESTRIPYAQSLIKDINKLNKDDDYIILGDLNSNYDEYLTFKNDRRLNDTQGITGINQVLNTSINENLIKKSDIINEFNIHYNLWNELDINDRKSSIYFGSSAQEKLDDISNRMIDGVQNKDVGAAGAALNEMVASIRGFNLDEFNPNKKLAWWQTLFGVTKPLVKFIQEYEDVRDQIDSISNSLEKHKSQLMTDIVSLDKLYDANLEYFRNLELYIKAGETKLEELEERIIPEYEAKVRDSGDDMLAIQEMKEIRGFRDELERRVHDLRLSRQVTMQSLPSIRLIQENDKSLISKITSTLVNTVPLWRNQLAQTVTIFRSHETANAVKDAADLTNELLEKNAEGLREANAEVRKQMERGIFDIESIKKANATFIATLDDSLRIAEEGKAARSEALVELQKTEHELKDALLAVKAKAAQVPELSTDTTQAKEG